MRLVKIDNLTADMILARTIYDEDRPLLKKGCTDLLKYKEKLKEKGVTKVYIKDELSQDIEIKEPISEEIRVKTKKVIKKAMKDFKLNKTFNVNRIKKTVKQLIMEMSGKKEIVLNLQDIHTVDTYVFSHSINVAILCIILGKSLQFNKKRLRQLTEGALLHDIGKAAIPKDILKKRGSLTQEEYEVVKTHTTIGFDKLRDYVAISSPARYMVKFHHEKVDGSGYPEGRTKDNIHLFARICCVADVLDALTSDRCYRNSWSNAKALKLINNSVGRKFDQQVVTKLNDNVAIYPTGTKVSLTTGEEALVKEQNFGNLVNPIVKIITDKEGNTLKSFKVINLANKPRLNIKKDLHHN